jgi:hypothetical protein
LMLFFGASSAIVFAPVDEALLACSSSGRTTPVNMTKKQ